MAPPLLYGTRRVAALLSVTAPAVTAWGHAGKLPAPDAYHVHANGSHAPLWTDATLRSWLAAIADWADTQDEEEEET